MAATGNTLTTSVNQTGYSTGTNHYDWGYYRTYPNYVNTYWYHDNKPNLKPCIQHILDNKDLKDKEKILLIEALLKAV